MSAGLDGVPVPKADLVVAELDGETVMLSPEQGAYFGMDEVGSHIWGLIQRRLPVRRICELLMEEFDVAPAHCQQEVVAFLERLDALGLISFEGSR